MSYFLFFLLAAVSIGAILGMIFSKNQAYNALFLILAFSSTGGLFALMGAPFIATVQIIIYAGAIMILFVFVIMMINIRDGMPAERKKWTVYFSIFIAIVFFAELFVVLKSILVPLSTVGIEGPSDPTSLGRLLFTEYLYPFEITSILIIAALVGSIVLVKKKENNDSN